MASNLVLYKVVLFKAYRMLPMEWELMRLGAEEKI